MNTSNITLSEATPEDAEMVFKAILAFHGKQDVGNHHHRNHQQAVNIQPGHKQSLSAQ